MSAEVRARHGVSSTGLANGLTSMEGERPRARIWREPLRAFNVGQRVFECLARIPENTFRSPANRTSAGCWYSIRVPAGNGNFLRSAHRPKYPPRPVEPDQLPST